MKIKLTHIIAISIISIIAISSCSRERIEPTPQMNTYEPVSTYMDTKKAEEQIIEIDTSGTAPIIGKDSTRIWIGKEILMFPDGSDVEWPFTIKLVELYTPKDMIYYQMPTVAGVKVLETEGEIRIRAYKEDSNGIEQELLLKPNKTFAIEMPSDSLRNDMKVYYGKDEGNFTDWTTNVTSIGGNSGDLYFSTATDGHQANIGKLGWVNCGKEHLGFNNITFSSEDDDLNNVGIFTYVPKYQSVIQAYNMTTAGIKDSSEVKIIAIGVNASNELYHTYIGATIYTDGIIPITLTPISDAELTSILDDL